MREQGLPSRAAPACLQTHSWALAALAAPALELALAPQALEAPLELAVLCLAGLPVLQQPPVLLAQALPAWGGAGEAS